MNLYNIPLETPSLQTVLPVLTQDGLIHGFYPITQTTFDGTETEYTLPDNVVVPLMVVTVDKDPNARALSQFVAAVFPAGLPFNYQPWSSASLIDGGYGNYSWYTLPTQGWIHHFGKGVMINAIQSNLNTDSPTSNTEPPPEAVDGALTWTASVAYASIASDCAFFDFNWMTLFEVKSGLKPVRITVLQNPAGSPAPFKATVVGVPTASENGVIFNTIRIMKLASNIGLGVYTFQFRVVDVSGQTTDVDLALTIL